MPRVLYTNGFSIMFKSDKKKSDRPKPHCSSTLQQRHPNVAHIEVRYSGYGDEGNIDDVKFYGEHANELELNDDQCVKLIDEVFFYVTPCGFECDDGGDGEIHICPATQKIIVHHNQNIVHQEQESYEV